MTEPILQGLPGCDRCTALHKEATFWREQRNLAAKVANDLADMDDYEGRLEALRSLLRRENERREAAEHEVLRLTSVLTQAHDDQCGCLGGLVSEWSSL